MRRRVSSELRKVANQMRLIGVSAIERETGPRHRVRRITCGMLPQHILESHDATERFRRDADAGPERPFELTMTDAALASERIDRHASRGRENRSYRPDHEIVSPPQSTAEKAADPFHSVDVRRGGRQLRMQ